MKNTIKLALVSSLFALSSCGAVEGLFGAKPECKNDFARLTFSDVDTSGDDKISLEEFEKIYERSPENKDKNKIKTTFIEVNSNGDDAIDKDEFLKVTDEDAFTYTFKFEGCSGKDLSRVNN